MIGEPLSVKEKRDKLKKFMLENFDFKGLKEAGFYSNGIRPSRYDKQAKTVREYFGYTTVYQYNANNKLPKDPEFLKKYKKWAGA